MTVLEHLADALRNAATYNRHDLSAPQLILWPDGERLWEKAVPLMRGALTNLLVLEPATSGQSHGPSTRLRYAVSRGSWTEVPVIYLPGVSRLSFRGASGFPEEARHLFALQHQGQFWTQQNGKDWTPLAFLTSGEGGLGLSVSRDREASQALADQLTNLLQANVEDLSARHLEASDFHRLVASDPNGMVLQWLASPGEVPAQWGVARWRGFVALCKETFGLDPEKDGHLVALERLVSGGGRWDQAWARYLEAPKTYAGVRKALELIQPKDLLDGDNDRIPAVNAVQEDALRESLKALSNSPKGSARETLARLAAENVKRAASVWHELGEAPLAGAVVQLGILAETLKQGAPAHDWNALAHAYMDVWWRIDASAWKALAGVRHSRDREAVSAALRAVYLPWLEELSARVNALASSYPNTDPGKTSRVLQPAPGTVLLFVDGLRCELGLELNRMLEGLGLKSQIETSWSALPTVTSTAKPAWRPLADQLSGAVLSEAFEPQTMAGKPLKTQGFRDLLSTVGWPWLDPVGVGNPSESAWTEAGSFDRYGHDDGARMAWRIDEELKSVASRIRELLNAGWKTVRVVTDHGWLLLPGGLPSVQLPGHLTMSKWGRCAIAQPGAQHGFKEVAWFWGGQHCVILAPGVSVFKAGVEYAHGGLSLQEALIPTLTVTSPSGTERTITIESVKWTGLRVQVQIQDSSPELTLDLRTKPGDATSSLLSATQRQKTPDSGGRISLVVEDDDLLGTAAVLVLIRDGHVIAKQTTTVGDN